MQRSILALAAVIDLVAGQYKFCTDGKCSDCPTSIANLGTGFPKCLVYSTEDVFFNQPGFNESEGGLVSPFLFPSFLLPFFSTYLPFAFFFRMS